MPKDPAEHPGTDGRLAKAEATQAALRSAGRALFGELGFDATPLCALCARAGVTTGALYHHFGDKKGLFAAVAEELDAQAVALVGQAQQRALAQGLDAWQAFLAALDAFVLAAQDPAVRRIALVDAPAVLGTQAWLAIRERQGLGALQRSLQALQAHGVLTPGDVGLRARLVLGLLYSTVEALAHDPRPAPVALADARTLLHTLLAGLRTR
ncbi:MAG: TetR/AcrR family transcriptional regulator [Rhodoferax sp.]